MSRLKKLAQLATAKAFELLRKAQFQPEAPVYIAESIVCHVAAGDWTGEERTVNPKSGKPSFTVKEASFSLKNPEGVMEDFVVRFKGQVKDIDDSMDLQVLLYTACRDYQTTSGKIIKKGDQQIFAILV